MLHPLLFSLPCTSSSTQKIRSPVGLVDPSSCKPHARQIVPATNGDSWDQLDCGVCVIPHILGGTSRPAHICHASFIYPAVAIYSCIFWVYRVDSVLRSRCMLSRLYSLQPYLLPYIKNSSLGPFVPVSCISGLTF